MMLRTVLSWQLHFKPFFVQRSVPLECGNKPSINIERTSVLEYGRAAIPRENTDEVLSMINILFIDVILKKGTQQMLH